MDKNNFTFTFVAIFWFMEWNYKAIGLPYVIIKQGVVFQC
jgi:hypothetical protein